MRQREKEEREINKKKENEKRQKEIERETENKIEQKIQRVLYRER